MRLTGICYTFKMLALLRPRLPLLVLTAALALAGCESACGKAHELSESVGERLISVEQEQQLGAHMAAELRSQVRLVTDPEVQRYIDGLGGQLVAATAGLPAGMEFHFQVIDAPEVVNAIAMPGGYVYVYSGLLLAVDSEAELAGVLAHEIAHVAERHVVAQLVTTMGIQAIRALALGEADSQLAYLVTDLATQGALGAYSRTAEREADLLGVHALARAGYSPLGYAAFFDQLAAQRQPDLLYQFASSHPDPAERAARARQLAAELDVAPRRGDDTRLQRIAARLRR